MHKKRSVEHLKIRENSKIINNRFLEKKTKILESCHKQVIDWWWMFFECKDIQKKESHKYQHRVKELGIEERTKSMKLKFYNGHWFYIEYLDTLTSRWEGLIASKDLRTAEIMDCTSITYSLKRVKQILYEMVKCFR